MRRILFFSIPAMIMACSILPMVDSTRQADTIPLKVNESKVDRLSAYRLLAEQKPLHFEKPKPKKIAAYSGSCSGIKTDNLKTEIIAKLECLTVELDR